MEPLLQKSDAGRAVFLTSGAAGKASPMGALRGLQSRARNDGARLGQ